MIKLIKNPAQIVTVNTKGKNYKRGKDMDRLDVLENYFIVIEDGVIKDLLPNSELHKMASDEQVDATDKVILPGLVECHTHAAFTGSRAGEFMLKLKGVGYEEIAKQGGGILSTVKSVREASFDELESATKSRTEYFMQQGITTLEIKSGYGLSFYDEIKLLQVIKHLNKSMPIDIAATFLGAHTYPPEYNNDHERYLEIIIDELIPYVSEHNLAEFCDVFCEATAFSKEETDKIFTAAEKTKMKLKLHTEQFNNIGGLETALAHKAVSVDHLEVLKDEQLDLLKGKSTVCTLLPGVSFFLNHNYAPTRKLIDNNSIVALATDFNPGSSNIADINLIMSLAALNMKMTIDETISAVTINAAKALGREKTVGSIEPGKKADLAIFDCKEYPEIVYQVGKNLCTSVIKDGEVIYEKQ